MGNVSNVTNGYKIKIGDRIKLTNEPCTTIFRVVEVGKYIIKLRKRVGNLRIFEYSFHFKKSKYFKIQGKKKQKRIITNFES